MSWSHCLCTLSLVLLHLDGPHPHGYVLAVPGGQPQVTRVPELAMCVVGSIGIRPLVGRVVITVDEKPIADRHVQDQVKLSSKKNTQRR